MKFQRLCWDSAERHISVLFRLSPICLALRVHPAILLLNGLAFLSTGVMGCVATVAPSHSPGSTDASVNGSGGTSGPLPGTGGQVDTGTGGGAIATGGSGASASSGSGGAGSGTGAAGPGSGGAKPGTGGSAAASGGATASGGSGTGGGTQTCPPACGPTTDQFYDNGKLATVRITFDQADTGTYTPAQWLDLLWSKWNHCPPYEKTDLARVTFQYESPDGVGNITMKDVGMRIRGSMRRDFNQVQGFKLDFQKWLGTATGAARRRFADINRLNTLSIESDPSHMIQCLSYKVMRDFGLKTAPKCNHLKVYVNGTYYGLMENVEEPDHGRFQAHHFGTTTGEIYEGSPSDCNFKDGAAKLLYSGDAFSSYTAQYNIARGTTADAEAHLIPMLKCGDATQTASDATFKTCISEWLNVDQWLKEIAAESLTPSVESFMVERNYLLYFVPDAAAPHGGRFQLSSWDLDVSFHKASCYPSNCDPFTSTAGFYGPSGTRAKLATRLTTVFKTEYCKAMNDFVSTVYKPALVDDMAKVIEPAMVNEPVTSQSNWQAEVTKIRNFITSHTTAVQSQISAACN